MSWNADKARERIRNSISQAPRVNVRRFEEYRPFYEARKSEMNFAKQPVSPPLFNLERGAAVLVNTVQIYLTIVNYDDQRIIDGNETEASHSDALQFLHFYYSACDRVAENSYAQRVDFHESRMHAVVLDDVDNGLSPVALAQALTFIRDFQAVADEANRQLAANRFSARFRIGIDAGPCVAINNGNGLEQEPLFLGSAANHAAKLADGDTPGIFISDRIRAIMGLGHLGVFEGYTPVSEIELSNFIMRHSESSLSDTDLSDPFNQQVLLEAWQEEISNHTAFDPTIPNFVFHYKPPPLSDIKYVDLSPSKSIRMELVSLYADLSDYTAFIDEAIQKNEIPQAVLALFVIREELQKVTEADFGGRKVRFIGDCIHALIAEGSATETNNEKSVASAFTCAGALRSSFKLCQEELDNIDNLGLSIGLEIGPTPISRVGIRGERSVRVASSRATTISEQMQRQSGSNDIKLGPTALSLLSMAMADLVNDEGAAPEIDYDDVSTSVLDGESVQAAPYYARPTSSNENYGRAHFETL